MAYQPDKEQMDELYESILMLKDKDECRRFFNDVCTVRERQRFHHTSPFLIDS